MKRFLATKCCFCCGVTKKQETNGTFTASHKDTKPPQVAVHNIVSDKNGNGTYSKETFTNQAFNDDENSVFTCTLKGSKESFGKPRQSRQTSDISELFRLPNPDEKSLSELVIEEYDNKSKSLRTGEMGDFSGYRTGDSSAASETDAFDGENAAFEADELNNELNNTKSFTQNDSNNAVNREKENSENVPAKMPLGAKNQNTNKTEWMDKLKQDLLNDDDDEFLDETSDEEARETESSTRDSSEDTNRPPVPQNPPSVTSLPTQTSVSKIFCERAIVIDNGSYVVRGGWAGEFTPESCVRNVIGHWRAEASEAWQEALGSKFIGNTAIQRHSTLALDHPINDGKIGNWRGLQDVWSHVVGSDMDADMTHHPIFVTESASVEKKQREKMLEVLIETIRVPGVCMRSQAAMCSTSVGNKVGLVVNCGYGTTEIVPVYDGYQLPHLTTTMTVGGRHITDYLARLIQRERGFTFTSVAEMEIVNVIKERFGIVSSGDRAKTQTELVDYKLPDGKELHLGKELSLCGEPLFNPGLVGNSALGLPLLIKQTLDRIDPDMIAETNSTILLSGGSSKLGGLHGNLQANLNDVVEGYQMISPTSGDNAAWVGGSIYAGQSNFHDFCVTEDIYFEYGAKVIHRMCL